MDAEPAEIAATRRWLERAVIGLNLCPFAKAVHVKRQVRFVLSDARDTNALRDELERELRLLESIDAAEIDTTLIVHPHVLQDFFDYNQFLDVADGCVRELGLEGDIQVASFHPDYVFAGEAEDDPSNCTNRAPYPTLHLLREASIDRAVAAYPDPDVIIERNIATLRRLGVDGYRRLLADDQA
ncbi:DUF1415 domain-containing protein [Lysobacter sp. TY2-98]|uniref:DUF1415 domain-containing protein n=1 Tax=Lysobacter sp. TY2-98 TaxID=2290922 RepID=UPI000E209BC0|nr:DUF1415 domain-containing protein [Lysobacter sp. TY2-98]AXK72752.1 DUF1415 domain-containing protein [Lysobacter sp. TY2-98]